MQPGFLRDRGLARFTLSALVGVAVVGCSAPQRAVAPPPPVVATVVAQDGTIRPTELLAGIVAPYQNVAIQSSLTEPTDAVYVNEGDRVRAGQVLARLDVADLQAQLDSDLATAASDKANTTHTVYQGSLTISQGVQSLNGAEAAVLQARQTLANDAANLNRDRQLVGPGYIAQQTVDQQSTLVHNDQQALRSAIAALAAAKANVEANGTLNAGGLQSSAVEQAQAQVKVALAQAAQQRVQIAKATIVSPIDGVVVNRNLNPGEYPGTRQIFTIQQVDPIYAILNGSGSQIARIAYDAPVTIVSSDLGDRQLQGRVVGVLNQINPGSTNFEVKVLLHNPQRKLRPGMAIEGNISLPSLRGVRIPATAFTDDTRSTIMTVAADGTVHTVRVVESADDGSSAIVTGLPAGTRVVTNGQSGLGDGQKVAIR